MPEVGNRYTASFRATANLTDGSTHSCAGQGDLQYRTERKHREALLCRLYLLRRPLKKKEYTVKMKKLSFAL